MTHAAIDDIYPLSPLQQGLLFHGLYAPGGGQYVLQIVCTLEGPLDPAAFQATWAHLLERHGALRASFAWEEVEEPLQVVHRAVTPPVEAFDWRSFSDDAWRQELAAHLKADRERGFNLEQPPLMRLTLARTGDARHVFVWTCHHLLTDGWSLGLLLREYLATYRALSEGRAPLLPPVRPYRDYIAWVKAQPRDAAERYWRERLRGFTSPTPVPFARTARAGDTPRHAQRTLTFSREHSDALRALAREHALTLNTVFQGAWALLLSRYTREQDVVFGATGSGRPATLPGAESMVGMFINTLPVRVAVEPDAVLVPWLKQLQATQAEAQAHEHSSLTEVQGWSELPRGQPLFDTLLVFENFPRTLAGDAAGGGPRIGDIDVIDYTHFALDLAVIPGEALSLLLTYDLQRFEEAPVSRLLSHVLHLLTRMAAKPHATLGSLDVLPEEERRRLLTEWSQRPVARPMDRPVQALIQEQAARTPERIAVTHWEASLTYGELDSLANRAAHRLIAGGVDADVLVAILAERDLRFPAAVLGVLKAGGGYLPLDPSLPPERLARILEQSRVPTVVVSPGQQALLEEALAKVGGPRPAVVASGELFAQGGLETPPPVRNADASLFYVIYTSGSTGVPKGAMLDHRGKLNHILSMIDFMKLGPDDVMAETATQSFDVSVWQFLAPLVVGARVEIFDTELQYDAPRFLAEVERRGVTVLEVVPSLLANLLEELERLGERRPPLQALRWPMPTGEVLPPAHCRRWLRMYPHKPLLNGYGPTEVCDDTNLFVIEHPPAEDAERVPIGFPLDNLEMYVLDRRMLPVPQGVPGELYIGGVGVARGYLHDPARTAAVFLPNPFASRPGARFYKSGDVCRYREDGALEFVERADFQVKLRGFRIEPGEIETTLQRHPRIKQAVVLVRELGGGKELVAYVSLQDALEGAAAPSRADVEAELRGFLRERLPHYMVPAALVILPFLKLNANGKIDRKALPAPDADLFAKRVVKAPGTPMQQGLVAIWEEVLGRGPIGVDENFFELGGHSLLAIRVLSRMREALGVDVPLRSLFELVTVEQLANKLEALRWAAEAPPASGAGDDEREEFEF
ncbi:amino acid adenylation domain-containing protein [Corallococcus sp. ZKHCc1 1396]|uniref:Amino acid adenylation domain-containing protein n=1 Tax=Corallococcus soli TaxID=2710757 RepID=A0ABR9PUZ3_9BACT|nr:non-ribosomal peptide synthetase [Corallococcus soli]MBE4751756.1 amino acid adenylation domain-containing protein [Corallococcus soli]